MTEEVDAGHRIHEDMEGKSSQAEFTSLGDRLDLKIFLISKLEVPHSGKKRGQRLALFLLHVPHSDNALA